MQCFKKVQLLKLDVFSEVKKVVVGQVSKWHKLDKSEVGEDHHVHKLLELMGNLWLKLGK